MNDRLPALQVWFTVEEAAAYLRQSVRKDEAYGWKLKTDKGHADIVFRNSSNGYYGGDMRLCAGDPPDVVTPITDDWHA